MLTEISNDLIHHFLHKCDVNEYLKSQTMKSLYDILNIHYTNSQISMKTGFDIYPQSDFIARSLRNKLSIHKKVYTYSWTTKSEYNVKNTLHIYLKDDDDLPDTRLLIKAISYITSFSDKPSYNNSFTSVI